MSTPWFSSRRALHSLAALVLLGVLGAGCDSVPKGALTEGELVRLPEAGVELRVPTGWTVRLSDDSLLLTRETPYGGGFPTLSIRAIDSEEATVLGVDGKTVQRGSVQFTYRYLRWNNARGQGYRLEVIASTGGALIFADASVWDPSPKIHAEFFEREFWPVLNSIRSVQTTGR